MMKRIGEKDICEIFGKNIKKFRKQYGWSQEQLAEKIDISATFLSNVETGKAWISPKTIANLCNVLQIETHELFLTSYLISENAYTLTDRLVRDITNSVCNSIEVVHERYRDVWKSDTTN